MASEQAAFSQKLKDAVETLLDSYVRILQAAKLGARVSDAAGAHRRCAGAARPAGPARRHWGGGPARARVLLTLAAPRPCRVRRAPGATASTRSGCS